MKFLPALFNRTKAMGGPLASPSLSWVGWRHLFSVREASPGNWQRHINLDADAMIAQSLIFACLKLISGDISKLRPMLKQLRGGIWQEVVNPAYSSTLAQPNGYQDGMKFLETWVLSKLVHGNFYGLKVFDNRNVVSQILPLDPLRVIPKVANDGSGAVFYELHPDRLSGIVETITVPARALIHDRWFCVHHPLVGTSPLMAAMSPAAQALATERTLSHFYRQGAQPSGYLTAPAQIDPDTAKRLEDRYENDYAGPENAGRVLVLGSGMEFKQSSINVATAEIVDQQKWSGSMIAACFAVPGYKIGLMDQPRAINNIEALAVEYFSQALQGLIQAIELSMTAGLSLASGYKVALDTDALLRMDSNTKATYWGNLVSKGIAAPNEARAAFDLPPVKGGESPYLQMQNYSLAALAARDAAGPAPASAAPPPAE